MPIQQSSPAPYIADSPLHRQSSADLVLEQHQSLNLVPCAWDEFLQLDTPPCGYYDLVDGLVVHCSYMADADHNGLGKAHSTVLECSDRHLFEHSTPTLQVISDNAKPVWTVSERDDSSNRASSSTSPPPARRQALAYGLRHPDYTIVKSRRDSTGSSSTTRDPQIKQTIQHPHPYSTKLLVVAEITSHSTRQVDLYDKWAAYARSEVPLYIIFDRGASPNSRKRVIVGALVSFSDAKKSWHGDPDKAKKEKPQDPPTYYKKVYDSADKVDCSLFAQLDLTAAQLLDFETMRVLANKMHHDRASQRDRAESEKKRADDEKKRADRMAEELRRRKAERSQKAQTTEETRTERKASLGSSSSSPTKSPKHKKSRKHD